MKFPARTLALALATLFTGLMAGLFYGFSVAIIPAFARLPDASFIAATQAINEAIQNPVFALGFVGAPLALLAAAGLHWHQPRAGRKCLVGAALLVYLVGSLGVTLAVHIPLNESLAAFPLARASSAQCAAARQHFTRPWNRWHQVRTVASICTLALLVGACLNPATARKAQGAE